MVLCWSNVVVGLVGGLGFFWTRDTFSVFTFALFQQLFSKCAEVACKYRSPVTSFDTLLAILYKSTSLLMHNTEK